MGMSAVQIPCAWESNYKADAIELGTPVPPNEVECVRDRDVFLQKLVRALKHLQEHVIHLRTPGVCK